MIRKTHFVHYPIDQKQQQESNRDYDEVWNIFKQVISTGDTLVYSPQTPKQDLKTHWFAPKIHTYIYESQTGQILGSYIIKPNQPDLGSHIANASFIVHPDYQGQKIGQKMCEHCLNTAKELGFKAMQFNIVVSTNKAALAMWGKFGFEIVGTVPEGFENRKEGKFVDTYVMYRKL